MNRIVHFDSVDSTNRVAREMARAGEAHGTLVVADMQTGGRGRRGRSWISPAGEGVFMSLIVRPKGDAAQAAMLSMQTALAVAWAIARTTGLDARIKWPNDIVVGGRKVCGMLLEMDVSEAHGLSVVAGIGINVHQSVFPPEIELTAASLDLLCGRRVSRQAVIEAFLAAFDEAQALAERGKAALMEEYRLRSATLGQRVQVISATETYAGTAQSVTDDGALVVIDEEGRRRVVLAADVSVRGIMGYA